MKGKICNRTPLLLRLTVYFLLLVITASGLSVYYASKIPDKYYTFDSSKDSFTVNSTYPLTTQVRNDDGNYSVDFKLMGIIPVRSVSVEVLSERSLMAGGQAFGIKMLYDGLMVVGFSPVETVDGEKTPAFSVGLRVGDMIVSANGRTDLTNEIFSRIVRESGGEAVELKIKRKNVEFTVEVCPELNTNGDLQLGCFVRDSTAGIGTVTFIDPVKGTFGGLGHGIYDSDTGALMPIRKGEAVSAEIYSVVRGSAGAPGELKGVFNENDRLGTLVKNRDEGVFGSVSSDCSVSGNIYPIGLSYEVEEGPATILCTVDESGVREFDINIEKVLKTGSGTVKNMVISITDGELVSITGGIVQGMSGSPIIQNGKLIGAVTHVMINEPTRGYGIFIENMLAAAE